MDQNALMEEVGMAGRQLGEAIVMFNQAIADKLGLNATDHECMDILYRHGPITAGELADHTGLTTGAITGVIDRLERAGFVRRERDPHDRRRVIIQLVRDPAIEQRMAKLFESYSRSMNELTKFYNNQQLALILDFTTRSLEVVRRETRKLRDMDAADISH